MSEHRKRGFDEEWIGETFAVAQVTPLRHIYLYLNIYKYSQIDMRIGETFAVAQVTPV